jgi:curved DNA-binding protein CbpA
MSDENYYEELGVEPGATRDEIRDAHRQRVTDLEAAREKKGVTEAQLQANREAVAKVRSAWNVLSDPFQRQRYDSKLNAPDENDGVEIVDDDDAGPQPGTATQLTGWRKLLAPPPPKNAAAGAGNGNGAASTSAARPTRNGRPRPEPTIVLPAGMQLAEPRVRGMALLFDVAVLIVIFFGVSLVLPGLIQSDYKDIQDKITKVNDLHDARQSLDDAQKSVNDAKSASDKKSAQSDLTSAQKDYNTAKKDAQKQGVTNTDGSAKQLQKQSDDLTDKIRTTGYITSGITLVLGLAYLVPITVRKGYTLGMRSRKLRIVRVDGSPPGWYPSFTRFALPLLLAVAIPSFGVILGLGMVAWGYFDRNGQGIHDKLARTVVVAA